MLPAKNDPPLNLEVPRPSFAVARPNSAFGFQTAVILPEMDHNQDGRRGDGNTEAGDDRMDYQEDMYLSEDGMVAVNEPEGVDRRNPGKLCQ